MVPYVRSARHGCGRYAAGRSASGAPGPDFGKHLLRRHGHRVGIRDVLVAVQGGELGRLDEEVVAFGTVLGQRETVEMPALRAQSRPVSVAAARRSRRRGTAHEAAAPLPLIRGNPVASRPPRAWTVSAITRDGSAVCASGPSAAKVSIVRARAAGAFSGLDTPWCGAQSRELFVQQAEPRMTAALACELEAVTGVASADSARDRRTTGPPPLEEVETACDPARDRDGVRSEVPASSRI